MPDHTLLAPFCTRSAGETARESAVRRGEGSAIRRRTGLGALLAVAATALLSQPVFAAEETAPERILVFGDSQAQGLAGGVQRLYRADREHRVLDRSKISTGLWHGSYDWPQQAQLLAENERADVAICLFGANDRPPIRSGGQINPALLQRFTETYATRVTEIAESFRKASVPLVWVGHPIVRDPVYAEDMVLLNEIFASRAVAAGAIFVSTWEVFKGPDGAFAAYGRGCDGQTTRLRADDGIHMTPAGYDVITAMLVPYFDRYRKPIPPAAPAQPAISSVTPPGRG